MADLLPITECELDRDLLAPIEGEIGSLRIVPISSLRVDPTYQRGISMASVRNVRKIAQTFDWKKFTPIIGVEIGDGLIAVIDGQHRATSALSRGVTEVPAYIVKAGISEAASAFAAINGNVTRMSVVDLYRARLAAQDPEIVKLQRVLDAAEVKVIGSRGGFGVGETEAVKVLERAMNVYGDQLLILVLQCITQTGDGNAGSIIGSVVNGIAKALLTKIDLLQTPSKIFDIFDGISITKLLQDAKIEFLRTGNPPQFIITREINALIRAQPMAEAA